MADSDNSAASKPLKSVLAKLVGGGLEHHGDSCSFSYAIYITQNSWTKKQKTRRSGFLSWFEAKGLQTTVLLCHHAVKHRDGEHGVEA
jgi:hypothetical protein